MFQPRKILVPIDFSEFSEMAFRQAVELAKRFDSEMVLLNVMSEHLNEKQLYFLDDEKVRDLQKKVMDHTEEEMDSWIEKLCPGGKVPIVKRIRMGVPYYEILNEANECGADLIAISSHGKSAFKEILYGSTTEKVIRHAKCSVLMVKDKDRRGA